MKTPSRDAMYVSINIYCRALCHTSSSSNAIPIRALSHFHNAAARNVGICTIYVYVTKPVKYFTMRHLGATITYFMRNTGSQNTMAFVVQKVSGSREKNIGIHTVYGLAYARQWLSIPAFIANTPPVLDKGNNASHKLSF